MVTKAFYTILLVAIIAGCKGQPRQVNLIVYTPFLNPKTTYDALVNDFTPEKIVDSLKIIGMPIQVTYLYAELDSSKIEQLGMDFQNVQTQVSILLENKNELKDLDQFIIKKEGEKVPISSFASFILTSKNYKPEIFTVHPDMFYEKGRRAVKIKFYCQKRNVKALISLIQNSIDKYSDKPRNGRNQIEYIIAIEKIR